MWSYYGSKSKIIDLYPKPKYSKIIEPFAGSARYALKWNDRDVLLLDKDEKIVRLWKWLQSCSAGDLDRLPRLTAGDSLKNYSLSDGEYLYLSYCVTQGSVGGRPGVTERSGPQLGYKIKETKKILPLIKHWNIILGDYFDIPNQEATWFIDPPYQYGGEYYRHSNKKIDFAKLSDWSQERSGQVIVCENMKANWMNFKPLQEFKGQVHTTIEAIWTNEKSNYNNEQLKIAI